MEPHVLTIGPDYKKLGGGIASVLSTYAKYDNNFRFMPTYSSENNIINILLFPFSLLKIILYLLKNKDVSIIHIHGASYISFFRKYFLYLLLKVFFRKKIVYHIHGAEYHLFYSNAGMFKKWPIKHFVEGVDAVIVLSEQWKKFFLSEFNIKKAYILNNTIPYPEEIDVKNNDIINYLFLGRIGDRKGTFDLIDAICDIRSKIEDKVLFYIGGDGDVGRLQQRIKECKLENIVRYVGWISGKEKTELLKKSHIYILPSYNEGLPISILEAMSYRMPIISTAVGGIPEVLKDQYNGIVVTPGHRNEIAEAIMFFVNNTEKIPEMGGHSIQIVKDFLPDMVIKNLHMIYQQVLMVKCDVNG